MGMVDIFEDLCLDAEAEGNRDLWLKAAAAALIIALRKTAKARAAYWTEEAVRCIASADPEAEEEFQGLLQYSPWRALDEVVEAFERKYFTLDEVLD
ncbi:MAG: hypothetical protein GX202_09810 [Firmicutes bacterium]|nr:hypothetical protein [Bacillota bacterium]